MKYLKASIMAYCFRNLIHDTLLLYRDSNPVSLE